MEEFAPAHNICEDLGLQLNPKAQSIYSEIELTFFFFFFFLSFPCLILFYYFLTTPISNF